MVRGELDWIAMRAQLEAPAAKAIAQLDELLAESPDDLRRVEDLADFLVGRARQLAMRRRYVEGLALVDRALPLAEPLVARELGVERYEELLALAHNNRAMCVGHA